MGSLRYCYPPQQALVGAQAGPSRPLAGWAEEQSLICVAAVDVEGRANVLLYQLEDADCRGVGRFLPFFFVFFLCMSPF
jgi:hypothetical protein